ncbi:MAG: hypothetical protein INR69_04870 [Mucilaginibacter polytrichastri]|nr:hypothetical protein [Mucilaginibacter polytrichastri]
MRKSTIEKLCCPFDKQAVTLKIITQDMEGKILEGLLTCTSCRRIYPIIHGIPVMSPDEYRQFDLEKPVIESWEEKQRTIRG